MSKTRKLLEKCRQFGEDFNYAFDKIDELRPEIYSNIEPDEWFFITVK
ncbi:MAG: hypothetical protein P3W91_003225 [Fervidobacterium sp.]|nr:hypothetical protein [Fervidobacterium sp.]